MIFQMWNSAWNKLAYLDKHSTLYLAMSDGQCCELNSQWSETTFCWNILNDLMLIQI